MNTKNVPDDTDLGVLRSRIAEIEKRLAAEITHELELLYGELQVSPDSISVDLLSVATIGDRTERKIVSSVRLDVRL